MRMAVVWPTERKGVRNNVVKWIVGETEWKKVVMEYYRGMVGCEGG